MSVDSRRKTLGAAKISKGKQISLPEKVREVLKVDSRDVVVFYLELDGKVTIQP